MKITVVVCTHNRSELLSKILDDLSAQVVPSAEFDVLIVDNHSIDNTRDVAEAYCSRYQNIHYLREERVGLSHARNLGLAHARGEYVAYTDDDCRIPSDWLKRVLIILEEKAPLALGGPYLPYYTTPKPQWFKDAYGTFFWGQYPSKAGPVSDFHLSGGNFIICRKALEALGGFRLDLGMIGDQIGYAEEDLVQIRAKQCWPDRVIFFDPQLVVHHLVPARKMSISWRIQQQYQRGKSLARLKHSDAVPIELREFILRWIKTVIAIGISFVHGIFLRDKHEYPYCLQWIYEKTSLYWSHLGSLAQRRVFLSDVSSPGLND
jgi:glucosyl-dolichyl phosphate glucuronosyltransferase